MKVKVHVLGFIGDHPATDDEDPAVMIHGVLEIDGTLIEEVSRIEVVFAGGDFATVKAHMAPGKFEIVTHTQQTWDQLLHRPKTVTDSAGRLTATTERGTR